MQSHHPAPQNRWQGIDAYLDSRTLRLFSLGLASGFPWVLIGSILTLWLKDAGLSRTDIGYAGVIFAAYAINFLWSPIVDQLRLPLLKRLGQRKSWIIFAQLCMVIGCFAVTQTNPEINANATVLCCLAIAIASATQDIAIDAFRVDSFTTEETEHISAAAAIATAGWWTGFAGIGALALFLSDLPFLDWADLYRLAILLFIILIILTASCTEPDREERDSSRKTITNNYIKHFVQVNTSAKLTVAFFLLSPFTLAIWSLSGAPGISAAFKAYPLYVPSLLISGFVLLAIAITLLGRVDRQLQSASPQNAYSNKASRLDTALAWLCLSIAQPFNAFFSRNTAKVAIKLLLFIFLFKIGEAFLGRMSIIFYKELGFSNSDIASYSKLMSWLVTIVFSLVSGWLAIRFGILRALLIGGLAMAASNLMFAVMAWVGPNKALFAATIIIDGFTTAWSTVVFVAFISSLCQHTFSATQYALLASLGTLGRTLLASSSGQLVDTLNGNWSLFFIITALMVLPALAVLIWLKPALSEINETPSTVRAE